MKALVTGGGGFLGKRIVEMLSQRGDHVRALGRNAYPHLQRQGIPCIQADVRDVAAVTAACQGVDTVFHVAGFAAPWAPTRDYYEINVRGTASVLQACREAKVQRLVYTSSPSVVIGEHGVENGRETLPYPRRYLSPYPDSKARAEQMVLDADGWEMVPNTVADDRPDDGEANVSTLRTCALRPHLIWGPGDPHIAVRLLRAARRGKLIMVGDGANMVDITYVDNAAHAHILAADNLAGAGQAGGKAYFIGDENPVRLWHWITDFLAQAGAPPVRKRLPYRVAKAMGAFCEMLYRALPALGEPPMTRFVALQLSQAHWFSHQQAHADLGYRPIVDPQTGMQRLQQWIREEHI